MSETELIVLSSVQIAERRQAIVLDAERPERTAADILVIDQESATALVGALPATQQRAIVMAACASSTVQQFAKGREGVLHAKGRTVADCGLIIPIIDLLEPKEAARIAALDTSLFPPISNHELWRNIEDAGIDLKDDVAVGEFRDLRTFEVRTHTGELKLHLLDVDPGRAFAYLLTIVTNEDEKWQSEMLELLGTELLALIFHMYFAGELQVDEDEWESFKAACPDEFWKHAYEEFNTSSCEAVLQVVVDAHKAAMEEAFRIADDQVKTIKAKAESAAAMEDDLLGED